MQFLIADTFTNSLAKLTGEEQKQVKTTAFDLQINPANPGFSFHKLDRAKDKNFWSVRVSRDIRIIVHRTKNSLLACFVGHHDPAYKWAERRRLEVHPKTGAAQLIEIPERVEKPQPDYQPPSAIPQPVKPAVFANIPDEILLRYGVPQDWLEDVKKADEDTLLVLVDHLPAEAAEALLELATGGTPQEPPEAGDDADPFAHPDAQRRFKLMTNVEELALALEFPWDKWTVFLHPAQQQWVRKSFNGPARVSGSAGTGKTIVALHRAVHLARANPDARVLLTTFSETLANALRNKVRRLASSEPSLMERLEVHALDAVGLKLYTSAFAAPQFADEGVISNLLRQGRDELGLTQYSERFLLGEWQDIVDAWHIENWEEYKDVKRLGRKTRLAEAQREQVWQLFSRMHKEIERLGLVTQSDVFSALAKELAGRKAPPYDFAIVDEAQDLSVAQLKFLAAMGGDRGDALFFAGDLGQRIFQLPFSWKSLGVDIRGRSRTLKINYRTSHQIRRQADLLLGEETVDVDGNVDNRAGTVSVFSGPAPQVRVLDELEEECGYVAQWLSELKDEGFLPHEIGIFVRSHSELPRAMEAAESAGLPYRVLDENLDTTTGKLSISTMHLAKGLEFRAVAVIACDDEIIPLQERIESVTDDADLDEVYETERHLLYVACTRAREALLLSAVDPASEFLDDFVGRGA